MRLAPLIALLPATALAAEAQKPLGERVGAWLEKAKSYIPSAIPSPIDAGAAAVAQRQIHELTASNWETVLAPRAVAAPGSNAAGKQEPENWMVLVTGGNRTCGPPPSRCEALNGEFNKTAALLAADRKAPNLGLVDCDRNAVLCSTWLAGVPSLWYIRLPVVEEGAQSPAATDVYVKRLNATTARAGDLVDFHRKREWEGTEPIGGYFHPFDGQLARYGVQKPLGYLIFLANMVPSWSFMLVISLTTRYFVTRRMSNPERRYGAETVQRANAANIPLGGAPAANER